MIYAVAITLTWIYVPGDRCQSVSLKNVVRTFDWAGSFLIVSAFVLIVFSLRCSWREFRYPVSYMYSEANSTSNGWATPYIIALLVIGILLLTAFVIVEAYVSLPLMPLR